ncbi:hypothetical protein Fmac_010835 [Flemingia macrophylla]|uniref:K+ potassium transporter C-terminal domain-containing protein n=1 Tax=Flemingia macrophylla TaxID=520843 RepID=A0ABD1MKP8_9FABA
MFKSACSSFCSKWDQYLIRSSYKIPSFLVLIHDKWKTFMFDAWIAAIPIAYVALEERFLFQQVKPREQRIFRCTVRHGFRDVLGDHVEFECQLVQHLKEILSLENFMLEDEGTNTEGKTVTLGNENDMTTTTNATDEDTTVQSSVSSDSIQGFEVTKEIEFIKKQMENGVVYMLGEVEVVADPKSSIFNKKSCHAFDF